MKRLIEFLLSGCWHEWGIEKTIAVYGDLNETEILRGNKVPVGHKYILRCKKCGEMKSFRTY